jgi:hypothetical protein
MRRHLAPILAAAALLLPAVLAGQVSDASHPAAGEVRLSGAGLLAGHDRTFGTLADPDGALRRLQRPFSATLTAVEYSPLSDLFDRLEAAWPAITSEEDTFDLSRDALHLEADGLRFRAEVRRAPLEVELGLPGRLSLLASVPIVRHRLELTGAGVAAATVGVNPDPVSNRRLLATIAGDASLNPLGNSPLLPVSGSEAGVALQSRVAAATGGDTLFLPAAPLASIPAAGLPGVEERVPTGRFGTGPAGWEAGDAEVGIAFQPLPAGDGITPPPPEARPTVRARVEARVRLPTGAEPGPAYPFTPLPKTGWTGGSAAAAADLFLARRWEVAVAVRAAARLPRDEVVSPLVVGEQEEPPQDGVTVRTTPGQELGVLVHPRFRLAPEISLGAVGRWHHHAGDRYEVAGGGVVEEPVRTATLVGVAAEYSGMPAFVERGEGWPLRVRFEWGRTVAGAGGAPAVTRAGVEASLFLRAWGASR